MILGQLHQIDSQGRETVPAVATRATGIGYPLMNGPGRASFPFTAPRVSQAAVNAGCSAILPRRAEQPAPTFLGFSQIASRHAPVQVRLVGLTRSLGVNRPTRLYDGQARRAQPSSATFHKSPQTPACKRVVPSLETYS